MNELATVEQGSLAVLESLAVEGRACLENIAANMINLGRILSQAKEVLPHGEYESWVIEKIGIDPDYATRFRNVYERFGQKPEYARFGKSKLLKMLALPAGTEDEFVAAHDVENMSAREVEEAVKQARAEAQEEIRKEREACRRAELRAEELENQQAEPDPKKEKELSDLRRKVQEQDMLLSQQQVLLNQAQQGNYNAMSAAALQEDEAEAPRIGLSAEAFDTAIKDFIGNICGLRKCCATTENPKRSD